MVRNQLSKQEAPMFWEGMSVGQKVKSLHSWMYGFFCLNLFFSALFLVILYSWAKEPIEFLLEQKIILENELERTEQVGCRVAVAPVFNEIMAHINDNPAEWPTDIYDVCGSAVSGFPGGFVRCDRGVNQEAGVTWAFDLKVIQQRDERASPNLSCVVEVQIDHTGRVLFTSANVHPMEEVTGD